MTVKGQICQIPNFVDFTWAKRCLLALGRVYPQNHTQTKCTSKIEIPAPLALLSFDPGGTIHDGDSPQKKIHLIEKKLVDSFIPQGCQVAKQKNVTETY